MNYQNQSTLQPVPSSILHNSTDVRTQHTRLAARQVAGFASRNLKSVYRQVRSKLAWQGPAAPQS